MADKPKKYTQEWFERLEPQEKMKVANQHRLNTDRNICKKTGKKLQSSKNKQLLCMETEWEKIDPLELFFWSRHPIGEYEWKVDWIEYTRYIYTQFKPKIANALLDNDSLCCLSYPLLENNKLLLKDVYEEKIHSDRLTIDALKCEVNRLKRNVKDERRDHYLALKMIKHIIRDDIMLVRLMDNMLNSVKFDNGYCNGSIRTANLHVVDLNNKYWTQKEDK
jgi:hypothetical protein